MIVALIGAALAQDAADGFSAQNYRPPIDSRTSLWTERTATYAERTFTFHALASYTRNPLVFWFVNDTRERLVENVWELDVAGAAHLGRFRLGAIAPIYLASNGEAVESGGGLGDLALDLKGVALRDGDAPLGLAFAGRLLLPTATVVAPLANRNTGWELSALADKQISDFVLAANVGFRGAPSVALDNIALDDQLFYRGAVSWLLTDDDSTGLSFDLTGQVNLKETSDAGAPVEWLLGGWTRIERDWSVRGGFGTGLNDGIGSPELRVLLGVAYAPGQDAAPPAPAPMTNLVVAVHDPQGGPVRGVESALAAEPPLAGSDELKGSVAPGTYAYTAKAPGYAPLSESLLVPEVADHRIDLTMKPVPLPVTVRLTDLDGNPLTGEWSLDGTTWTPVTNGVAATELVLGDYLLKGRSAGFQDGEEKLVVKADRDNVAEIELGKRVVARADRIDLEEVVRFDTNSARIRSESFPLLDEVATILLRHPEITKIRVEGHTDSVGDAAYNLGLSQRRAASVVAYLAKKGVAAERMSSVGYGEEKPIDTNDTAEGRQKNRRVWVFIEERAD